MSVERELPEGWALSTLGDVIAPSSEKVEPDEHPDAPYLSLEHLESATCRILGIGRGADVKSTKAVFRAGDVLYGKLRPYLNKVCIPEFNGICSTDILVFPASRWIDNRLLLRLLSAQRLVDYANHHSSGVQLPRTSFDKLKEFEFPLAPLAEQKRIVAKVEELLARANAARERLARVPAILKRFRQAVLAAACSGRLTEDWREQQGEVEHPVKADKEFVLTSLGENWPELSEGWLCATVESVCSAIVDCPHSTPEWAYTGEVCLRTTNFRPGQLDLSEVRFVSQETFLSRISRLEPQTGDVVYSREGGILGIACMIPAGFRACLGQRMMLMRAGPWILPTFLMHVLNSPATLAVVKSLTGGTASPHLNVGDVRSFAVPVPTLPEQHEILKKVSAMLKLADTIAKRVAAATARADKLTQAILAKAFRGELVPTEAELARQEGRAYEPASVLLERIRAERASAAVGRPTRGHRAKRTHDPA